MRIATDNIQKAGSYERLAQHTQAANERRRVASRTAMECPRFKPSR